MFTLWVKRPGLEADHIHLYPEQKLSTIRDILPFPGTLSFVASEMTSLSSGYCVPQIVFRESRQFFKQVEKFP
jgi:hypothetical protein